MEIKAVASILKSDGQEIKIEKTLKSYEAAEEWVRNMFNNERCVFSACPTLALVRLAQ